jgi:hypothetical protein
MKLKEFLGFPLRSALEAGRPSVTLSAARVWRCSALLLGIAALLPLISKISPLVNIPKWDEFICSYDAARILSGQVPYRDFFQFIPPGVLLLLAAWFKLLGAACLTLERWLSLPLALGAWALSCRALKRASWPLEEALLLSALYIAACFPFWANSSHHWIVFLLLSASFEAYDFRGGRVRGLAGWAFLGLTGALCFLTLQTAFVGLLALWGTVLLLSGHNRLSRGLVLAMGFAVGIGPVIIWLASKGAAGAFVNDVFIWTSGHYRAEGGINAVPLVGDLYARLAALWSPPPGNPMVPAWQALAGSVTYAALTVASLWILGVFLVRVLGRVRQRRFSSAFEAGVLAMTAVELTLYLRGKTDWLHLVFLLPRLGLPWLLLAGAARPADKQPCVFWKVGAASLLVMAALFHSAGLIRHKPAAWEFLDVDRTTRDAPVNRWLRAQPWLMPGDTLAAFPEGGEVYLYVRPAAVGFTLLYSPLDNYYTREQYARAAEQIEKNRPRCVLITTEQEKEYLSQDSLARTLRENYKRFAIVGEAAVYRLGETE